MVKTQRANPKVSVLFKKKNLRTNSKDEVIQEEMNSLKNKSPARLITVPSGALLMSGLLWSDESFVTGSLWFSVSHQSPSEAHRNYHHKGALERVKPKG